MVAPNKRRLKKKHTKTASGKREYRFKEQGAKHKCAITGRTLSGVSHQRQNEKNKGSKSQRRPSAPFGGVLSGEAREQVFIELGKVLAGAKQIDDVDAKYRTYVKQAMKLSE